MNTRKLDQSKATSCFTFIQVPNNCLLLQEVIAELPTQTKRQHVVSECPENTHNTNIVSVQEENITNTQQILYSRWHILRVVTITVFYSNYTTETSQ